ncbi:MAG: hypothetical protein ACJAT1_000771 [Marivirga sp.]|jgi:hypothetical protein
MKKLVYTITLTSALFLFFSCSKQAQETSDKALLSQEASIDQASFDASKSDPKAVLLAETVIAAHGGKEAWNKARYISWNFLGSRDLVWDKYTGLVRIDYPREESTYIINIQEDTGQVMLRNQLIKDPDSLINYIDRGKQIWVNDAYWLVFPFKLMDPGVELHYVGSDTTVSGKKAEIIALSFDEVGFTPENKYYAYIDPQTKLILQWDYFSKATDSLPSLSSEWTEYERYGDLFLSSGRGARKLGNIAVSQSIDSTLFIF